MKAAVYTRHGPAREVLRVEEVERPEPGPDEVRVRVHVSGVNPTDVRFRSGAVPSTIDGFQIPHHDGAGVIDAVGTGVDPALIGERVWVWLAATRRWGTAAQWTVVPAPHASPLPAGASDDLGASVGIPAMTAHRCLFADGPVHGKSVLVAGGAGAVGHFAIELARRAGARVAATVDTGEKERLAREAGAEKVVYYTRDDAAGQLREFAFPMDRVVEVAFAANLDLDLSLAGPPTVIVSYSSVGPDPAVPVRRCMSANVTLRFVLVYGVPELHRLRASDDIAAAMAAGHLSELPVHRFPLDEIAAAHEAVENGVVGKVLVDVP